MLHGGQSLRVFTKWCSDEKNLIIMPGFCVANTVGAKVISGMKKIEIAGRVVIDLYLLLYGLEIQKYE